MARTTEMEKVTILAGIVGREFQCSTWAMNMAIQKEATTIHTGMTIMSIGQLFLLGQKREILRLAPILLPHDQIPSVCLGLEDFPTADWLQWHGHQPGNLTGPRQADSWPFPWMKHKVRSMWPSMPATCRCLSDCRSTQSTDGIQWWTQASQRRLTSSPMNYQTTFSL